MLLFSFFLFSCSNGDVYKDRIISEVKLNEVSRFEYEDGRAIRMTADDSLIYISSSPDNTVRVFNYQGELCKTIGQKGEAPWENGSIWSFGKDASSYWLHDYPKMALKKYDATTDSLLKFRKFITKHNVIFLQDNQFVVPHVDDEKGIFYISLYDAMKDSILKSVDICKLSARFEKLPPYGDFTFQGNLCKNSVGQSVFYCLYNSSFFFIDKNFSKVTHHYDIRNLPISEPIITNDWIKLNPDNAGILAGAMDEKYIYFVAPKYKGSKLNKKLKGILIDVYDLNTKKYITSFESPKTAHKIGTIAKTNKGLVLGDYHGNIYVYDNSFMTEIEKIAKQKNL